MERDTLYKLGWIGGLGLCAVLGAGCGSGTVKIVDSVGDTGWPDTGDSSVIDSDTGGGDTGDTDGETGDTADTGEDSGEDTGEDTGVEIIPDLVVDCRGSGDFTEIQPAIDASVSGDVIGVKRCVYEERLDYLGKTITVYGIDGSDVTILDAGGEGTALNVETGEGFGTRFAGFTITNGYDELNGAAVEVAMSNLEMEDVQITANLDGESMIESLGGWVDLKNVTITGNDVNHTGQAILADGGSLTAEDLVLDCDNGVAGIYAHLSLLLDRVTITCAEGYGIQNYHGEIWMQRSTVTGGIHGLYTYDEAGTEEDPDDPDEKMYIYNSAIGGGSTGVMALFQDVRIVNSVLWGADSALSMTACNTASYVTNSVLMNAACGITGDQRLTASYNAYWNNDADGCGITVTPTVSEDPGFVAFPEDLSLETFSPLINAGDPSRGSEDVDGSRNDIGVFGGPWGEYGGWSGPEQMTQ